MVIGYIKTNKQQHGIFLAGLNIEHSSMSLRGHSLIKIQNATLHVYDIGARSKISRGMTADKRKEET